MKLSLKNKSYDKHTCRDQGVDRGILEECQPQFADEDLPENKFAEKEGFSRVPTSTSTNGVHASFFTSNCFISKAVLGKAKS